MADAIQLETLAPGLHQVRGYADARAILADTRFSHWVLRDRSGADPAAAIGRWLQAMDPRATHPVRPVVLAALNRATSPTQRARLRQDACDLLEAARRDGVLEIEAAYARPLTGALIARVLGVEPGLLSGLLPTLCDQIPRALFPMLGQTSDAGYFEAWGRCAASGCPDGLGSGLRDVLTQAGEAGDLGVSAAMFAFAASDNITRFVTEAAHDAAGRPELWRSLVAEPSGLPEALEEWLRLSPPLRMVHLVAAEPLAGGRVQLGDSVLVALDQANRDGRVYEAPEAFQPGRRQRHLAFGAGPLACIGARLALMVAEVALAELVRAGEPDPSALPSSRIRLVPTAQASEGARADART